MTDAAQAESSAFRRRSASSAGILTQSATKEGA